MPLKSVEEAPELPVFVSLNGDVPSTRQEIGETQIAVLRTNKSPSSSSRPRADLWEIARQKRLQMTQTSRNADANDCAPYRRSRGACRTRALQNRTRGGR